MSKIRVANAPCSWGVLEFDLSGEAAGYQQVLDEMAQSGFVGTELGDWGFMPTEPGALQNELKQRNLSMLGAFVPVALAVESTHEAGLENALQVAKLLKEVSDSPFIVLSDDNARSDIRRKNAGRVKKEHGLTDEQWETFVKGAEEIAWRVLDETGVKTVFHHHCAGYVETPDEVDRFLSMTNPLLIGLCLDTGHYAFGGGDPLAALKRHVDRIWHVHFKDFDSAVAREAEKNNWDYFEAVKRGVFCELGKGNVDFNAITQELRRTEYGGWIVVEQDVLPGMGSPFQSAQRNREYLKSLGL